MVTISIIKIPEAEDFVDTEDVQRKVQCVYSWNDGHKACETPVQKKDNRVGFLSLWLIATSLKELCLVCSAYFFNLIFFQLHTSPRARVQIINTLFV